MIRVDKIRKHTNVHLNGFLWGQQKLTARKIDVK